MQKEKFLFRGQVEPWKLRTSFHRSKRYDLKEYMRKDIVKIHRKLSSITNHFFNLDIPDEYGSFLNLLQHHGYPTPLLDWSYSPYVATFFAFKDLPKNTNSEDCIRIYIFDNEKWVSKLPQVYEIAPSFPHLSVMEFISIDNPRLIPQQAITTVTNIDDIENYIQTIEKNIHTEFLSAIDIPKKYRDEVINDLKFMGITAGSLFPSIDGICEEQKEAYF